MGRKIIIYGMGAFSSPDELKEYIERDVFANDDGRFEYPQEKDADVILLSLNGSLYGLFDIKRKEKLTDEERLEYPKARAIYIVKSPTLLYENAVALLPLGIKGIQFGKPVSEEEFQKIQELAGKTRECRRVPI